MKFYGEIVKGDCIGRKIGFPTINVAATGIDLDYGVYTCLVAVKEDVYMGIMHYGPKSFATRKRAVVEIHLLDFDDNVYGEAVEVEVFDKIRDIQEFAGLDDLSEQIKKDVEVVKGIDP